MTESMSTLKIVVVPSPETNDHEVRLLVDDGDIISRFHGMMGLDPDELLISPCPLSPTAASHTTIIARCGCGVTGCGAVDVAIERTGDVVTWRDPRSSAVIHFSADAYEAEVGRALRDFGWESPDRTAARLISSRVGRLALARLGFEYCWSSGRILPGHMTVALSLVPGPYQILVHVRSDELSPEHAAQRCLATLADEPASWSNVVWHAQAQGLPAPVSAGAGWRSGA